MDGYDFLAFGYPDAKLRYEPLDEQLWNLGKFPEFFSLL